MENKENFNLKMKLISISLKLNKLELESLENICNILNINKNNITTKGELINIIIEYLKKLDKTEINIFENTLNINIDNSQINLNTENNSINEEIMQNDQSSESEISNINGKIKDININKYKKKRNYLEMLSESKKILLGQSQIISNDSEQINLNQSKSENNDILSNSENINLKYKTDENKKKKKYNKKYDKFLDKQNTIYYYYTDADDNEWQFTEINGTLNKYYFKCSTNKCNAFGMIDRHNENKIFTLTKEHNIKYIAHTYFKKNICIKKLLNSEIKKEEWEKEEIRLALFKYYFSNNISSNEENCKLFFKQYLKDLFIINEKIEEEIKKANYIRYIQINLIKPFMRN